MTFQTSNYSEFARVRDMMGERAVLERLLAEVRPDDVVYDVGGNIGIYTCFLAATGIGSVLSFEPHPKNAYRIRENLDQNNLSGRVFQGALSDTDGTVSLDVDHDGRVGAGEHALSFAAPTDSDSNDQEHLEVGVMRGDSLIQDRDLPSPTILKIDVEGAELNVLRGLSDALDHGCRLVYCEVHPGKLPNYGGTIEELHQELHSHGFSVKELEDSNRSTQQFIRAQKPAVSENIK